MFFVFFISKYSFDYFQHGIVDFVSLERASLREISGGSRKRDLKRAFALVESNGTVHFLIAGSDTEYIDWVNSISRAINMYSVEHPNTSMDGMLLQSPSLHSFNSVSSNASIDDTSKHVRTLGRSFAKVVQAAKVKGQAAVARGIGSSAQTADNNVFDCAVMTNGSATVSNSIMPTETKGESYNGDSGNTELGTNPNVQQLRNRFASVGKATKNRFGSAISAAKQKGKEAVQLRRTGAAMNARATSGSLNAGTIVSSSLAQNEIWTCSTCTFGNASKDTKCQMCESKKSEDDPNVSHIGTNMGTSSWSQSLTAGGNLLDIGSAPFGGNTFDAKSDGINQNDHEPTDHGVSKDDRSFVSDSLDDEDYDLAERQSQIGIKQRIGSVVRRARIATSEGRNIGRRHESLLGAPKGQKLNNVALRGQLRSPTHPFGEWGGEIEELQLKQFVEKLIIRVTIDPDAQIRGKSESFPSQVTIRNDSQSLVDETLSHDENTERNEKAELTRPTNNTLVDSISQTNSAYWDHFLDVTFKIQVSRCNFGDVTVTTESFDLVRTLPEVAALHTYLSESIAQIPSCTVDQELKRDSSGNLGLTTLDCIRTTGKLLGGLLDLPFHGRPIGEQLRKYYGKVNIV
jgi:hypothetical protein